MATTMKHRPVPPLKIKPILMNDNMQDRKWIKAFDFSYLTKEIERTFGNKLGNKDPSWNPNGSIYGWAKIPNCQKFTIRLNDFDERWAAADMKVRIKPEITIVPHMNRNMNRYMKYQMKRLTRHIPNPKLFWKIAIWLIKNSMCFRVSAINKVFPNWHRKRSLWKILQINKKAQEILDKDLSDAKFLRVYIPKDKTYRPLGVPYPEWRLVTHMYNNMLKVFLSSHYLPSQHGYIPRRGTLTAWKDIVRHVLSKDYIYECDLEQFFPTVHVNRISEILFSMGLPKDLVYRLENWNRCNPILPKDRKLNEDRYEMSEQDKIDIRNGYFRWESKLYDGIRDFVNANGWELLWESTGSTNVFEIVQEQWALLDMYRPAKVNNQFDGIPQGLATSPSLSILTLKEFLSQVPSVSYADDPIFYSNQEFNIKDEPEHGIVLNKSKSGWVKKGGKWLKPLKYLGLVYNPFKDTINARTRNGASLELTKDKRDLLLDHFEIPMDKDLDHPYFSWHRLLSNRIAGLLQSRMYQNKWNLDDLCQEFYLTFEDHSWVSKAKERRNGPSLNVFNASSYACLSLYHILDGYKRKLKGQVVRKVISYKLRVHQSLKELVRIRNPVGRPRIHPVYTDPPKRRGRPARILIPNNPTLPKRGRGRPRKISSNSHQV